MEELRSYKDLLDLIDINEKLLKTYQYNRKLLYAFHIKREGPAGYPSGTSFIDADTIHGGKKEMHPEDWDKILEEIGRLDLLIDIQEKTLKGYKETKEKIDDKLKGLEGIPYKIAYLKLVEGLNLQEIASKLGYSYQYIREIHAKTYKEPTDK